jgi:hypothetical protein
MTGENPFLYSIETDTATAGPKPFYLITSIEDSTHADSLAHNASSKVIRTDTILNFYTDIYKGHYLKPSNELPVIRKDSSPDWLFPILLIVMAVFTWLRLFYSKYFSQMLQAFSNNNLTNQIVRDENLLVQRASVYLSIIFNLIAAMLLYLISIRYNWHLAGIPAGFIRFILLAIVVSAVYTMKFLILKICGWLFSLDREMATYIFNTFLINNVLGIILVPFILLIAYNQNIPANAMIMTAIGISLLAWLYRISRGVLIGLARPSLSFLYLFLYLCTLEIAPLLVLLRIAVP